MKQSDKLLDVISTLKIIKFEINKTLPEISGNVKFFVERNLTMAEEFLLSAELGVEVLEKQKGGEDDRF